MQPFTGVAKAKPENRATKTRKRYKIKKTSGKKSGKHGTAKVKILKTSKPRPDVKKSVKKLLTKPKTKELKRHLYIFKSLTKKAKNRDIVLKKAPLTLYKTIRLLFKLMKKGAIPLSNTQRSRLKPWVNFIRENSTGKDSTVKNNVIQNGDGLSSILKTIIPIIGPILSMIV